MTEQDDRPSGRSRSHSAKHELEVVEEIRPALDVAAAASGPAVATEVEGADVHAIRGEQPAGPLVATRMLAEAVNEEHR